MNILILTGNFGMGHTSAANAIAEKIGNEFEDANVYVVDLFKNAFNSSNYDIPFRIMIKNGKFLYNQVYRHTEDSEKKKKLPFGKYFTRSLDEMIRKTDADVIISTLWSCSQVVSDYKQMTGCSIPLVTCITDVTSHSEWIQPNTDFYLTAAPKVKTELIRKGINPNRIIVSGVPVRAEFEAPYALDRPTQEKRLLIMGGGLGLLPKTKSFYERVNRLNGVKTTIITGSNTSLYNALTGRYENIEVLGFVNDVPKYMKNADLIISKPGGITLFEAISAELPLLSFCPFLEQEMRNGEFVVENNLGRVLPKDPDMWTAKIQDVLNNGELLNEIRANMRQFKTHLDENALLHILRDYEIQGAAVC